jgi:hypothetical protein
MRPLNRGVVRLREATILCASLFVAIGCRSLRWERERRICLESMERSQAPTSWRLDWSPEKNAVLYDWRLTLGLQTSTIGLPWVERFEGVELWFGPATFAAALEGRMANPGPDPYPISIPALRRALQSALEEREKGVPYGAETDRYVLKALLLTGKVALRDSSTGRFASYVHALRLGLGCGGLSGYGTAAFYLPEGRRFLLLGEWEA